MTDSGDLIKAGEIPGKDINIELITLSAKNLRTAADRVRNHGAAAVTNWSALSGSYQAPDAQQLFGVMIPVGTNTTAFGDHLDIATGALETFAEEVAPIKAELDRLRAEASAFYWDVKDGVTVDVRYGTRGGVYETTQEKAWHEDDATVDKNNQLRIDVNTQMELLWAAERRAANTIRALYCAAPLVADDGSGGANTYMYDEIPDDAEVPWGHPVERTEGCGEAAVTFVFEDFLWKGVVVGGLWGTVQGLGGLISYNSQTGEWGDWNFAGQAWKQLGQLAYTLTVPAPIQMAASTQDNAFGDWNRESQDTMVNTLKGIVAWDQWAENPGAAAGTTVFNVGTIFIPAGAAVTSIKSGALASKLATAARVIDYLDATSLVVKGGVGTFKITSSGLGQLSNLIDGLRVADNAASQIPSVSNSTISVGDSAVSGADEAIPPVREDVHVDAPVREPAQVGSTQGGTGGGLPPSGLPDRSGGSPLDDAPANPADDVPTNPADDAPANPADDAPTTPAEPAAPTTPSTGGLGRGTTPDEFDPSVGQGYASGDPHHPGYADPAPPVADHVRNDGSAGYMVTPRGTDAPWMPYQEQISGVLRNEDGNLIEWAQPGLGGRDVLFDGHTYRGEPPVEVFLDAKDWSAGFAYGDISGGRWGGQYQSMLSTAERQLDALPEGAILEWHVSNPATAARIRFLLEANELGDVRVIYTPKV